MVGKNPSIQHMDANRGIGELAHKGQAAKMVDVAVGDEDVRHRFQADGFVELLGYGRNPRQQLIIRLGKARAAIDQDQIIAIANNVNIVYQAGK